MFARLAAKVEERRALMEGETPAQRAERAGALPPGGAAAADTAAAAAAASTGGGAAPAKKVRRVRKRKVDTTAEGGRADEAPADDAGALPPNPDPAPPARRLSDTIDDFF